MPQYFIYNPQEFAPTFFATEAEWQKEIKDFDFHGLFGADGEWCEEVENVIAGTIPDGIKYNPDLEGDDFIEEDDFYEGYKTHEVKQHVVHTLDSDGNDENGEFHGHYDRIVDYSLEKISIESQLPKVAATQ